MTARVRVEPSGVELVVRAGESVMSAASREGVRWPTVCGGQGTCRTCYVIVERGQEWCAEVSPLEAAGIEALRHTVQGDVRLACQLRVEIDGNVTVRKSGVRRSAV